MLSTGTVAYEVGANIEATSFGGIAAVHRLAGKLGLADTLNDRLELLKVYLPYHESDHVLNLADLIPEPSTAATFAAASARPTWSR